jgi:hypothetical protein
MRAFYNILPRKYLTPLGSYVTIITGKKSKFSFFTKLPVSGIVRKRKTTHPTPVKRQFLLCPLCLLILNIWVLDWKKPESVVITWRW